MNRDVQIYPKIYIYIYWMLFEFDKVNWTVHSPHTLRWIALIWISWHQPAPQGALKQMWFYVALVLAPAVLHNVGNMPCKSSRVFRTNSREYGKVNQRRQEYGETSNMNAACTIYSMVIGLVASGCAVAVRCCCVQLLHQCMWKGPAVAKCHDPCHVVEPQQLLLYLMRLPLMALINLLMDWFWWIEACIFLPFESVTVEVSQYEVEATGSATYSTYTIHTMTMYDMIYTSHRFHKKYIHVVQR